MAELEQRYNHYDLFVGAFVQKFAELEFMLRRLLFVCSGLEDDNFTKIVRARNNSDVLKRLKRSLPKDLSPKKREALSAAFDHFGALTNLRNWVVHYGGHELNQDEFLIRLRPFEFSSQTKKSHHIFKKENALAAIRDLIKIETILAHHLDPDSRWIFNRKVLKRLMPYEYDPPGIKTRGK